MRDKGRPVVFAADRFAVNPVKPGTLVGDEMKNRDDKGNTEQETENRKDPDAFPVARNYAKIDDIGAESYNER